MTIPARFDVTADEIDTVVAAFYTGVRSDDVLGPVFAQKVTDWPTHEAKIAAFWRNAILHERAYSGNPMHTHRTAGNVNDGHFPVWLALFDATLRAHIRPDAAAAWSALAHRIGAGLRFGLAMDARADGVPDLR